MNLKQQCGNIHPSKFYSILCGIEKQKWKKKMNEHCNFDTGVATINIWLVITNIIDHLLKSQERTTAIEEKKGENFGGTK